MKNRMCKSWLEREEGNTDTPICLNQVSATFKTIKSDLRFFFFFVFRLVVFPDHTHLLFLSAKATFNKQNKIKTSKTAKV